jgi:hypothetical protein
MRYRAAILALSIFIGLLLANVYQWPQPVAVTTAASYGYIGPGYFYNANPSDPAKPPSVVRTPTGEKPQSKLWFNDGIWWADIFNNVVGSHHIYWLNLATQTWNDTGIVLDARPQTKADCLWDGTHLYVVSGGYDTNAPNVYPAQLYRYSYNPNAPNINNRYSLDFGPVLVRNGGAETVVIDKDTTGRLWITYTQNLKVYVNHSRTSDSDWDPNAATTIPGAPTTATSVDSDDISSLVAFDGKIGVLWSNESPGQFSNSSDTAFYFAYHADGAADADWTTVVVLRGSKPTGGIADDHINIKSLQADPSGNIFAMVKTSYNNTTDPQLLLVVAKKNGSSYSWNSYVESTHNDNQTRPLLLINTSQRTLYVFTSRESGGNVYYKSTSMDNPDFSNQTGPGTLFMTQSGYALNNITGTKQTVNAASGIVILTSHDNDSTSVDSVEADHYFHNYINLNPNGPTVTPNPLTPTSTPTPTHTPTPTTGPVNLKNPLYLPVLMK